MINGNKSQRLLGKSVLDFFEVDIYSHCLRMEIEESHHDDHLEHHHHQATNRGELFVVFSYLGSDAYGGRNQFFNGLTGIFQT